MHLGVVLTGCTKDVYYLTHRVAVMGIGPLYHLYNGFLTVTTLLEVG